MEVREWEALGHCKPQTDVVLMGRIDSTIPILEEVVWAYRIVIRSLGRGCDRKRYLHQAWLEDALRPNYWHT